MLPEIVVIYYGTSQDTQCRMKNQHTWSIFHCVVRAVFFLNCTPLSDNVLPNLNQKSSNVFSGVDRKTKASPPEVFWSI
jgi:hypothetical protein